MNCPAKIRPFPDNTELKCEKRTLHHQHEGTLRDYACPGSRTVIAWWDDDRRNFTGEFVECPERGCVLPAGHPRRHAP